MSSRYHQTQKFLQNYYNLSDNELSGLVNQMPPNDVYQYIGHKAEVLNKSIDPTRNNRLQQKIYDNDYWRKSYQTIKAESWPSCDSIEDFYNLPYEIQQECQLVHKFSPDIWFNENLTFDTFTKSQEWNYEIADLVKSKHLVLDNIDIIQNKNVIDFSTHTGSVAGLCLHQGAKHVTFTEIRSNFLELASERMSLMGFDTTCYRAELADIHEYETNTALCVDKDTVILSGVIYHVHDHCAILESIVKAKPKSIIIETCHYKKITNAEEPLIYWMAEETEKNTCNAFYQNSPMALVGFPNLSWFNFTMNFFGYRESKRVLYDAWFPTDDIITVETPSIVRSVQVFTNENH